MRGEIKAVDVRRGYEIQKLKDVLRFANESIGAIVATDSQLASQSKTQVQEDWNALQVRWQTFLQLEGIFQEKLCEVAIAELKLSEALELFLDRVNDSLDCGDVQSLSSDASQDMPQCARSYFERARELATLDHEIAELEINHRREQSKRDLLRGQRGPGHRAYDSR